MPSKDALVQNCQACETAERHVPTLHSPASGFAEMQKKLKFNPDDMFVSLVIEPGSKASSSNGSRAGASPGVVGVVEVSFIAHPEALKFLEPGTEGYCYVASMVVAPSWRRRGAAAALLAAAEAAAAAWDERQALLHVYQDNEAALQLYRRGGYELLHADNKAWAYVGARPRYLMCKRW
jgi:ribosomal protein S18 acetylase RimI-like enzyme